MLVFHSLNTPLFMGSCDMLRRKKSRNVPWSTTRTRHVPTGRETRENLAVSHRLASYVGGTGGQRAGTLEKFVTNYGIHIFKSNEVVLSLSEKVTPCQVTNSLQPIKHNTGLEPPKKVEGIRVS